MGRQVYKAKSQPDDPYRALYASDLHLSNRLPYAKVIERGITDRLFDQEKLLRRIFRAAVKAKVAAIYLLGDIFDQSLLDAITLTMFCRVLSDAPVPVFFLGGNHDAINPTRGERFTVEAFEEMGADFHYMETGEPLHPRSWLTLWPIEFCPVAETRQHISDIGEVMVDTEVNVLLMHNSVIGCLHVGWTCDHGLDAEDVTDGFDHTISGHFHNTQEFGGSGRYLGAPMHHHFGDVGRDAGFWIMQFNEDGTRDEYFVDGGMPRFHLFEWDEIFDGSAVTPSDAVAGDYVRIRVEATHAELAKIRPTVEEVVAQLRGVKMNAHWYHKPVYHHITRIKQIDGVDSALTPHEAIDEYVEAVDVDTSGLDLKELKAVGRDIFNTAAGSWPG